MNRRTLLKSALAATIAYATPWRTVKAAERMSGPEIRTVYESIRATIAYWEGRGCMVTVVRLRPDVFEAFGRRTIWRAPGQSPILVCVPGQVQDFRFDMAVTRSWVKA